MLQKKQVIMLPTNKTLGNLLLNKDNNRLFLNSYLSINNSCQPQLLYVLSDEEIKEGDYIYHPLDTGIVFCDKEHFETLQGCVDKVRYGYKKVIASTDKSLVESPNNRSDYHQLKSIPQIRESFVRAYIEAYNTGKPIEWVNIEYEEDSTGWNEILKLRSDNSIIVKPIKDSFTREEVKEACWLAWKWGKKDIDSKSTRISSLESDFNEWFNKNY
jgi:hypothetical protein